MKPLFLAAIDCVGFVVAICLGTMFALNGSAMVAFGFALGALAFLLSMLMQLEPAAFFVPRLFGGLQVLVFVAVLCVILGSTAEWV